MSDVLDRNYKSDPKWDSQQKIIIHDTVVSVKKNWQAIALGLRLAREREREKKHTDTHAGTQ